MECDPEDGNGEHENGEHENGEHVASYTKLTVNFYAKETVKDGTYTYTFVMPADNDDVTVDAADSVRRSVMSRTGWNAVKRRLSSK